MVKALVWRVRWSVPVLRRRRKPLGLRKRTMIFWLVFAFILILYVLFALIWRLVYLAFRTNKHDENVHRPIYQPHVPDVYKTTEWKKLASYVIWRDCGICQYCGATAVTAHHKTYDRGILCPAEDLEAICWECNTKEFKERHRWN